MKAFRSTGSEIVEIQVDVDPTGQPILPPDTTVDPRPDPLPGHYVWVVDNAWVQIPVPQENISFEYKKSMAIEKLRQYRNWYLEQPVTINNVVFDADNKARNNLTQAVVVNTAIGYLPPAWISNNNTPVPITTIADLMAIVTGVQTAFATRFFETNTIRQNILAAQTDAALDAIVIPQIPLRF